MKNTVITDLFEIADNVRYCTAEKITDTRQKQNPDRTAYKIQKQKSQERHFADAVKQTHRHAQTIYIFGNDDRKTAELVNQTFDTRLGYLIKTIVFDRFAQISADPVTEIVAEHSADCSRQINFQKLYGPKIAVVRHHA